MSPTFRDALALKVRSLVARHLEGGEGPTPVVARRAPHHPGPDSMRLPPPPPALHHAMRIADFANASSMRALQIEVTRYARALRDAAASPSLVSATVRGVIDDSLPTRAITIRTSEDRARLLALAAEWSAGPVL